MACTYTLEMSIGVRGSCVSPGGRVGGGRKSARCGFRQAVSQHPDVLAVQDKDSAPVHVARRNDSQPRSTSPGQIITRNHERCPPSHAQARARSCTRPHTPCPQRNRRRLPDALLTCSVAVRGTGQSNLVLPPQVLRRGSRSVLIDDLLA